MSVPAVLQVVKQWNKCIGEGFATTATTLTLITILTRWDLEPFSNKPVRPVARLVYQPRGLRPRVLARDAMGR